MKASFFIAALLAAQVPLASAQALAPAFDATGVWESDGGGTLQVFQRADKLTMVFVGPDFAQQFQATYADAINATGVQVRVTRASGCTTRMRQTFSVVAPDVINVRATALDSNCDLVRGQVIVNTLTRAL